VQKVNKELLPADENGKYLFGDTDYVETWKVWISLKINYSPITGVK